MVGWYSTCPELRENDLDLHVNFCSYVPNPVLVVIDVGLGIPTNAYYTKPSLEVTHIGFLTIYILLYIYLIILIALCFYSENRESLY